MADYRPNIQLTEARRRLRSPSGSGLEMSRQELAEAVNAAVYQRHCVLGRSGAPACIDGHTVAAYERGRHRWPGKEVREAFRAVLGAATDAELGFYIIRRTRSTRPHTSLSPAAADVALSRSGGGRRALLASIAGLAASAGLLDRGPLVGSGRIGAADVARLNAVIALYRSVDYENGGGALLVEVTRLADATWTLLDRPCSDPVRDDLLSAVAGVRQLAGWVAFDTGDHSQAQRHWLAAERAAVTAGDVRLAARVRYCQARQFQHLRHDRDALDCLRLAHEQLGTAATPAISTMLYGAQAASLAALGGGREALRTLGTATDAFDRVEADREPEWMRFYDRGELLAQHGRVYRDLARTDHRYAPEAVRWVTQAIEAFGAQNVRSTVLNEVGLCAALFLDAQPTAAVTVGGRVLAHAGQLTSERIYDRIRSLQRDLAASPRSSDVTDFGHTLTAIGPGTAS